MQGGPPRLLTAGLARASFGDEELWQGPEHELVKVRDGERGVAVVWCVQQAHVDEFGPGRAKLGGLALQDRSDVCGFLGERPEAGHGAQVGAQQISAALEQAVKDPLYMETSRKFVYDPVYVSPAALKDSVRYFESEIGPRLVKAFPPEPAKK